jgi:hypothetical protein
MAAYAAYSAELVGFSSLSLTIFSFFRVVQYLFCGARHEKDYGIGDVRWQLC